MRSTALVASVLILGSLLAGCVQPVEDGSLDQQNVDDLADATAAMLPDIITGFEEAAVLETEASGGSGIWFDEEADLLFATSLGGGLTIANITDPANPQTLSTLGDVYARDVDVLHLEGGQRIAVLGGSSDGIHLVDATDPTAPKLLSTTKLPGGTTAHNVAVVEGTSIIYNSGAGDAIYGLDAANPEDPELFEFPIPATVDGVAVTSNGCHDITVREDMGLAFCAGGGSRYGEGGGESFIWDISEDPKDPEWLSLIDDPRIWYHHQAVTNTEGDVLILNDEFIAPNCFREDAGVTTLQTPTAAAWFYDISDPENPKQMSHIQRPTPEDGPRANCGSHFGDVIDDRNVLVMGWYEGGTMMVNFDDPSEPRILDIAEPATSVWDARYHEGYVYTGASDVQVLKLVGE